jgi:hypothetical protein
MEHIQEIRVLIKKIIQETFETLEDEKIEIKPVNSEEINIILNSCDNNLRLPHFDKACSDKTVGERLQNVSDWSKSIKLEKNGK